VRDVRGFAGSNESNGARALFAQSGGSGPPPGQGGPGWGQGQPGQGQPGQGGQGGPGYGGGQPGQGGPPGGGYGGPPQGQGPPPGQGPGWGQGGSGGGYPPPNQKNWGGGGGGKSRTPMIVGAIVLAVLLIGALVFFVFMKGDGGNEEYVTTVCTEFSEWSESLSSVQQEFTPEADAAPADIKADVDAALETAVTETAELESELQDLEPPDIENGEEAHEAIVGAISETKTVFEDARSALAAVPADDPVALTEAFTTIGSDITTGATEAFAALDEVDTPELEEIQKDIPECEALSG
jgi:hypothetical protein